MDGYDDDLPPAELAREKRRDRDADAAARAGMRTGLAKQFKQVLDSQRKRVEDDERAAAGDASRGGRDAGKAGPSRPKR
ncbi:MAG: hypothetical protein ACHQ01_07145 [Candidatus Limnocylindrales bacterium]